MGGSAHKRRIAVVGGGPAGAAAALALAGRPGIEVLLLERRPLPRTKVCGSGLSPWTLEFLDRMGVGGEVRRHAFRIDGALIAGQKGDGIELRGHHETAVLLRSEFDQLLLRAAARRGAEIHDGVRVRALACQRDRLVGLHTSDGELEADAVVDASGANGRLTPAARGGPTLHSILGWYEGVQGASDVVELYFDRRLLPHYGWVFPESKTRVNIGLCFEADSPGGNARERFEEFTRERLGRRLRGAQRLGRLLGHPIHASGLPRRLDRPGVLTVGEAGRLVDSATAEGIYHGLVSGTLAGEYLAARAAARDGFGARALGGFTLRVQRSLGARMAGGRALQFALRREMLDTLLRWSGARVTRDGLRRLFTGLYHG